MTTTTLTKGLTGLLLGLVLVLALLGSALSGSAGQATPTAAVSHPASGRRAFRTTPRPI